MTTTLSLPSATEAETALPTQNFTTFNLPPEMVAPLERMNFTSPTPIQLLAIPLALAGKDVLGSAQTGTGKTAAFSIPLVAKLLLNPRASAMVLTPTRELAVQVIGVIHQLLGKNSPIKTALLIGGEPMPKQMDQLRARPRVIVGTPGRINDHLARGNLMLHTTSLLVLDETDRMLDMGFGIQIDEIIKYLPEQRQTLMFSATLPSGIVKISERYLKNPERVAAGSSNVPTKNVQQEIVRTTEANKYNDLLKQLDSRTGSIIVFVKTKFGAERLADKLCTQNHSADAIHGDLQQRKRERVISAFRNKRYRIMVATDIAARGLDIPHIEHVINYDLPQCPEDYIHRIGRTARAGAEGAAVSFISPEDTQKWRAIDRMLNPGSAPAGRDDYAGKSGKPGKKSGGFYGKSSGGGNKSGGKPFWGSKNAANNDRGGSSNNGNSNSSRPARSRPRREAASA